MKQRVCRPALRRTLTLIADDPPPPRMSRSGPHRWICSRNSASHHRACCTSATTCALGAGSVPDGVMYAFTWWRRSADRVFRSPLPPTPRLIGAIPSPEHRLGAWSRSMGRSRTPSIPIGCASRDVAATGSRRVQIDLGSKSTDRRRWRASDTSTTGTWRDPTTCRSLGHDDGGRRGAAARPEAERTS